MWGLNEDENALSLCVLAQHTDNEILDTLIRKGVLPGSGGARKSPLFRAVITKSFMLARRLVQEGASKDHICSIDGLTILGYLLLELSESNMSSLDFILENPLPSFIICPGRKSQSTVFHALVHSFSQADMSARFEERVWQVLLSKYPCKRTLELTDWMQYTPLRWAVFRTDEVAVTALLNAGARVNSLQDYIVNPRRAQFFKRGKRPGYGSLLYILWREHPECSRYSKWARGYIALMPNLGNKPGRIAKELQARVCLFIGPKLLLVWGAVYSAIALPCVFLYTFTGSSVFLIILFATGGGIIGGSLQLMGIYYFIWYYTVKYLFGFLPIGLSPRGGY
jgi:hypothetical protein